MKIADRKTEDPRAALLTLSFPGSAWERAAREAPPRTRPLTGLSLVPRLGLGTHCPRGSASPHGRRRGALRTDEEQAEPARRDIPRRPGGAWERGSPSAFRSAILNGLCPRA